MQINNGLAALQTARDQIKLAQRAGLNVDAQQKAVDDTEQQLRRIKATYFPNR